MNFPFFIARRYLFSKKSTHAINVISLISVLGVAVATMALVVVLSGFNGFSDLVASFFTNFDPQIKIEAAKGKAMSANDPLLLKVKKTTFSRGGYRMCRGPSISYLSRQTSYG